MYKIEKNVYVAKKPLWMSLLLFNVNPASYDPQETKEACRKYLKSIVKAAIEGRKYPWHQSYSRITEFGQVVVSEDSVKVLTKRGKLFLSFAISECNDSQTKQHEQP